MTSKRMGIVQSAEAEGTARLLFDPEKTRFQGVLINEDGESFRLRGFSKEVTKITPSTSVMIVEIFDEETGVTYRVDNVVIRRYREPDTERCMISLEHPSIKFTTNTVLLGNRADVEIRQYINPKLVDRGLEVLVGEMSLNLSTNYKANQQRRRVSMCDDAVTLILESSNDFLA